MLHHDPQIWNAIKNTLWLMAFAVPLQVIFAFGVAGMVVRAKAGVGFFRTVFYLPTLAPPVAATLGFTYILNPATGPVNTVLELVRHHRPPVVRVARRGRSPRSSCSGSGASATR